MSLSKKELVAKVVAEAGFSRKETESVIDALTSVVQRELAAGNDVPLAGLGKFLSVTRPARMGRNPRTGEAVQIAEKLTVKFSVSKTLKDAVAA